MVGVSELMDVVGVGDVGSVVVGDGVVVGVGVLGVGVGVGVGELGVGVGVGLPDGVGVPVGEPGVAEAVGDECRPDLDGCGVAATCATLALPEPAMRVAASGLCRGRPGASLRVAAMGGTRVGVWS
jgi:hypothetical protein